MNSDRSLGLLLSASTCTLIILFYLGCRGMSAEYQTVGPNSKQDELVLTKEQIDFIEENVPRLLQWQEFWTTGDPETSSVYTENIGKRLPARFISLKGAVIILMPKLDNEAIIYVKMPDGRLDYPGFGGWVGMREDKDFDEFIRTPPSSTNWSLFRSLIQTSEGKELNLTQEQREMYLNLFNSSTRCWMTEGKIILPGPGLPKYDPINEGKKHLLERITGKAIEEAEKTFDKDDWVTITIPNFNVGDPFVLVLIEQKKGGGIIVRFQLNTNPKDEPIIFAGVDNWDTSVNRYGIKDDTPEKIKRVSLKTLEYTVKEK